MDNYIHKNWLLNNKIGETLYHEVAADLPIIDYHNHLAPFDLASNRQYKNLTELWISNDPYKHRAMRIAGMPESGITGDAADEEKFLNWAKTFPKTIGNPLFQWSCLELKRVFGIDEVLQTSNALKIWRQCNAMLQTDGFGAYDLVSKWNPELLCTSDELLDDLAEHQIFASLKNNVKMLPSLRADSILGFSNVGYIYWLDRLSQKENRTIHNLDDFIECIRLRLNFFNEHGCILSDHALDAGFSFQRTDYGKAKGLFQQVLEKRNLDQNEIIQLRSFLLVILSEEYAKRNWTMQLHIGAQRSTSTRLKNLAGFAGGFASIGSGCNITALTSFLDTAESNGGLPDIILYTLNPADNAAFASLTGSFAQDGKSGKIQFGPAWWYNDHYEGIRAQLTALASYGLLGTFIGMTTDSRSIVSLSRHEYFRRVLCNLVGEWERDGQVPNDMELLSQLVRDVSYFNVKNRFNNKVEVHATK